eukprot:19692-Heterococcus_DN1.PRE.1
MPTSPLLLFTNTAAALTAYCRHWCCMLQQLLHSLNCHTSRASTHILQCRLYARYTVRCTEHQQGRCCCSPSAAAVSSNSSNTSSRSATTLRLRVLSEHASYVALLVDVTELMPLACQRRLMRTVTQKASTYDAGSWR